MDITVRWTDTVITDYERTFDTDRLPPDVAAELLQTRDGALEQHGELEPRGVLDSFLASAQGTDPAPYSTTAEREIESVTRKIPQHVRDDGAWCGWSGAETKEQGGLCPFRCKSLSES